jgi:4-hydroxybenzoate polyprenyltransferase
MIGLEEDRLSKPNRPIVSGRISLAEAQNLYLAVGVFAFIQSAYHGLVPCCIVYMLAIYLYNEGGLSRNWFMKSLLGAIGYICYCWGTTVILGVYRSSYCRKIHRMNIIFIKDHGRPLSKTSIIAIALSGLLHVTTVR